MYSAMYIQFCKGYIGWGLPKLTTSTNAAKLFCDIAQQIDKNKSLYLHTAEAEKTTVEAEGKVK